jgi:2',3'-cyclic-nucleotide 2'-phosphodiesterase (5'-nucleotidase family)
LRQKIYYKNMINQIKKMRTPFFLSLFFALLLIFGCKSTQKTTNAGGKESDTFEIVFLQLNDVYEISPSSTENIGGLARVATIRQRLLKKNPNTFTVLAGDFISPSVIGTLKHEGKRIKGKHIIEVFNALGVEYAVFGNHEFDYDDVDLQARIDESNFEWIGTNIRKKKGETFSKFIKNKNGIVTDCPDNLVLTAKNAAGNTLNIGLLGAIVNSNPKWYVQYNDFIENAKRSQIELSPKTDFCIGLTHLSIEEDRKLATAMPTIPLLMGGHEHDNHRETVGQTVIAKADANAKTVYVHTIKYNKTTKNIVLTSELIKIDGSIPDEPQTAAIIAKWEKIKVDALLSAGINAQNKLMELKEPLDCRDAYTRSNQAKVGRLITTAMSEVSKNNPDVVLVNSGSMRVDDLISGNLTELDIVRLLPFGGSIVEVEMKGSLLKKLMEASDKNHGTGGYLQVQHIKNENGNWLVNGGLLKSDNTYKVTLTDFLLTGNEANMDFLKTELTADGKSTNPEIISIFKPDAKDKTDLRNDIRLALIKYLSGNGKR